MIRFSIFLLGVLLCSCNVRYEGVPEKYDGLLDSAFLKAGGNAVELKKAMELSPVEQREGMAFLISYMPERDLKELKAEFLLKNAEYAYKVRKELPWGKNMPDSVFFNEVLPYASLNESRDNWREDFYNRFYKYAGDKQNIFDAIEAVNRNVRDELMVDYNTKREKPDQSSYESIRQHMASCSGLSILLTDAFRSVGIPSRIAGTPNWHDNRGNHNWCEVWADGQWYFTEYYPNRLNQSWFFADAGKATKDDAGHAIYASSFKPTGTYFPLVWDENIRYVPAENVTDRYTELYDAYESGIIADGDHVVVRLMMFKTETCTLNSDDRVAANVDVFCGKDQMGGGRTAGQEQDMNDVLEFLLEKNRTYTFKYENAAGQPEAVNIKVGDEPLEVKLYMQ